MAEVNNELDTLLTSYSSYVEIDDFTAIDNLIVELKKIISEINAGNKAMISEINYLKAKKYVLLTENNRLAIKLKTILGV